MNNLNIQKSKAIIQKAGTDALELLAKIGWSYTVSDGDGNEYTNIIRTKRSKQNDYSHHNASERFQRSSPGDQLFFEAREEEDLQLLQSALCSRATYVLGKGAYESQQVDNPVRGISFTIGGRVDTTGLDDALRAVQNANTGE